MSPTKKILITSTPKSTTKTRKLSKQTSDYDDDDGNDVKIKFLSLKQKTKTITTN